MLAERTGMAQVVSYEDVTAARPLPLAIAYMPILIVDDYGSMLATLRQMLRRLGFGNRFEATDGRMALKIIEQRRIELVISDLRMEDMDGLQLLRAVRASPTRPSLPFILISGNADRATVTQAIEAGVTDFIAKPFTVETLSSKLHKIVGALVKERL